MKLKALQCEVIHNLGHQLIQALISIQRHRLKTMVACGNAFLFTVKVENIAQTSQLSVLKQIRTDTLHL